MVAAAADGEVVDMGFLLNVGFVDPDGAAHEAVWVKPGVPFERRVRRAESTTAELE